jgi:hypothetical protein
MPDADDLNDEIASAAVKPQSATIDGNSVSQVSIDDKIKAADRAAGREAATANRPGLGLRFQQITPQYR